MSSAVSKGTNEPDWVKDGRSEACEKLVREWACGDAGWTGVALTASSSRSTTNDVTIWRRDWNVDAKQWPGLSAPKTVFKCHGLVAADPERVYNLLLNVGQTPSWNKSVMSYKILETVYGVDVTHTVSAPAGPGGVVSSRDFVNIRRSGQFGDAKAPSFSISSFGIEQHPGAPTNSWSIVRALNGPGGFVVRPSPSNSGHSDVCWILNADLRGWVSTSVVENASTGTLCNWIENLRIALAKPTAQ
jgi:hypothetical protein